MIIVEDAVFFSKSMERNKISFPCFQAPHESKMSVCVFSLGFMFRLRAYFLYIYALSIVSITFEKQNKSKSETNSNACTTVKLNEQNFFFY
jgi:hypothetical protein